MRRVLVRLVLRNEHVRKLDELHVVGEPRLVPSRSRRSAHVVQIKRVELLTEIFHDPAQRTSYQVGSGCGARIRNTMCSYSYQNFTVLLQQNSDHRLTLAFARARSRSGAHSGEYAQLRSSGMPSFLPLISLKNQTQSFLIK